MKREEILAMKPGREMDALVAEKVFGQSIRMLNEVRNGAFKQVYDRPVIDLGGGRYRYFNNYSTDISAAWEVVEKFEDMEIGKNGSDYVASMSHPGYYVQAKSAPEAICKAALLAVLDA